MPCTQGEPLHFMESDDMELNLDGKGQPQPEQAIAKSARPSVLDRLKAPPVHGAPEKPHKKEMEAR